MICIFCFTDISLVNLVMTINEIKKELKELNSKLDFCLINQEKLQRYILPGEKFIKRPTGFPSLPVKSEQELRALETFLSNDANLSAAVSVLLNVFVKSNDYVLKKLGIYFYFLCRVCILEDLLIKIVWTIQSGKYYEISSVMMWQINTAFKELRGNKSLKY